MRCRIELTLAGGPQPAKVSCLARLRTHSRGQKQVFPAGPFLPNQPRRTRRCRTLKHRASCVAELILTVVPSKGLSNSLARLALSNRGKKKSV